MRQVPTGNVQTERLRSPHHRVEELCRVDDMVRRVGLAALAKINRDVEWARFRAFYPPFGLLERIVRTDADLCP